MKTFARIQNKPTQQAFSPEQLIKKYVEEKYELVHFEMILDNLFMAPIKDEEWRQKKEDAERLFTETKESLDFLSHLLAQAQEVVKGE